MADSSVTLPPTGSGTATPVFSTRTNLAGEHMEVVMVGIDGSDSVVGSDATNGLDVDVTRVQGTVTVDGSAVTQPVSHAALTELAAAIDTEVQVDVVGALPAGTNNIGDVDVLTVPAPLSISGGGTEATALRVTVASDSTGVLSVDDNAGSLTVDGTVTANQGSAGTAWEVVGDVAADAAVPANPLAIGGRASTVIPTAVSADGDSVYNWLNRSGAQVVAVAPHVGLNSDPFNLQHETAQYTTAQTGVALVTPTAGKKLVVTKVQIQVGGTTAGTMQLWFGGSADTTYTRGTDRAIFDGEFAPSATLKPGVVMDGPWIAGAADDVLRVTDSAAINPLTVTVWFYEI